MKATRLGDRIFSRPAFLAEPPHKSRVWILNILIALLVYYVASMAMSVVLTPIQLFYLFRQLDLRSFIGTDGLLDLVGYMTEVMDILRHLPPWVFLLTLYLFITIILAVYICRVKIEKGTPLSLGLSREGAGKQYLLGYAAGAGLLVLTMALCVLTGGLRFGVQAAPSLADGVWVVLSFFGFMIQSMGEEILCRGFLMTALARRNSRLTAVLVNSIFFAALHVFNAGLTLLAIVNLFLFGVLASLLVFKTGNLWTAAALHASWNFVQSSVFGVNVSGTYTPSLLRAEATDTVLWHGGTFGLEGGLCVTIVLIVGIVFLALWQPKHGAPLPAEA